MLRDERIWRFLCGLWTIVFMVFVLVDFFSFHRYEALATPLAALYAGVLTLYVGTKEFDRWYDRHDSSHPGEFFVVGWTILMFILFGFTMLNGAAYVLSPEVVATYIMVLTIFALTQKSKQLHREHKQRK
jgi:uncharacterized membrane protein YhaH (DUF805 family)